METVKIAGVAYPVSYNMGAVIGVMKDSREVSLDSLLKKVQGIAATGGQLAGSETEIQNDLFQLMQLGSIVIHHGAINQSIIDGTEFPFTRWEQTAAHLKSLRTAAKHIMLFYVALSELYAEDEDAEPVKKLMTETTLDPLPLED